MLVELECVVVVDVVEVVVDVVEVVVVVVVADQAKVVVAEIPTPEPPQLAFTWYVPAIQLGVPPATASKE